MTFLRLFADTAAYKLTDLLGSAGATVGIIICGTIFLNFISAKYTELSNRYRDMGSEYRSGGAGETRHASLQTLLCSYRRRLRLMQWASWMAAVALLCFLASVLVGGLSMLYPPEVIFRTVGTAGLFLGLVLIGVAVALELGESMLTYRELDHEVADLDDPAKRGTW